VFLVQEITDEDRMSLCLIRWLCNDAFIDCAVLNDDYGILWMAYCN
jgi:hypothetical protein